MPAGRHPIAIVGPYPPLRGGIAQFNDRLHVHLERAGHRVTGISYRRQYPDLFFPGRTQFEPDPGISRAEPILDSIGPRSWKRAARIIVDSGAQEVVLAYWMPFLAPALASLAGRLQAAGIRVTALVHNARPHERQPFGSVLTNRFFGRCDRLIALSPTVARDIRAAGARGEVLVRPHPVYEQYGETLDKRAARQALGLNEDDRILLFFGLVRAYKGLDVLLDAMGRLSSSGDTKRLRLFLVVAGECYEKSQRYHEQIRQLHLAERVRFTDTYIPDADVATYFSAADVVIQPYRSATQSGVVQTAFQFGRPVIVTGVGALPEMVEDGKDALVIPPEDPAATAAAIRSFFEGDRAARLSRGAEAARGKWTWESFVRTFEDPPERNP